MKQLLLALLLFVAPSASAGPINDVFGEGVFDLQWGASLADVKKAFPNGEVKDFGGIIYYVINDGRTLFGIERIKKNYIRFGFDAAGRFHGVAIEFPVNIDAGSGEFARLLSVLDTQFGPHTSDPQQQLLIPVFRWPIDNGIIMGVVYQTTVETSFLTSSVASELSFTLGKTLKATATDAKSMGF
jgi:hypothetical protein